MTVRGADYKRRKNDNYPTPLPVTRALFRNVKFGKTIFDPACGKLELILTAARGVGKQAYGRDIINGHGNQFDFLTHRYSFGKNVSVVTNPPYGDRRGTLALKFIERALDLTRKHRTKVAMLLPIDFDSGKTRRHVFEHPAFALKLVLLDRVKWFNGQSGSTNHAWFIWDWQNSGLSPLIKYTTVDE